MKIELVFNESAPLIMDTDISIEEAINCYCGKYLDLGADEYPCIDKVIIMYVYDNEGNIIKRFDQWGNEFQKSWFGK